MNHPLETRYHTVWEQTLGQKELSADNVAGSRFFFDFHSKDDSSGTVAVPRRFDTYGIVCGLPFEENVQTLLAKLWQQCLSIIGAPLAYGVEPANRHTEIFLFQRPGEDFSREEVNAGLKASLKTMDGLPAFKIVLCHPFLTPDGTIVVPGFDEPPGIVDQLRSKLEANVATFPKKQSQWVHISLGRILEPIDERRLTPLLDLMQERWGEVISETKVTELLWIWERQWYMVDRQILHRRQLADSSREAVAYPPASPSRGA